MAFLEEESGRLGGTISDKESSVASGDEEDLELGRTGRNGEDEDDLGLDKTSRGDRAWAEEVIKKSFNPDWGRVIVDAGR